MIEIDLKPLSINEAFQGRRFKTNKHKAFEKALLLLLLPHKKEKIIGPYFLEYRLSLQNYARTDISNLVKVMEDCLVKSGIVQDDSYCQLMIISKIPADTSSFSLILHKGVNMEPSRNCVFCQTDLGKKSTKPICEKCRKEYNTPQQVYSYHECKRCKKQFLGHGNAQRCQECAYEHKIEMMQKNSKERNAKLKKGAIT
jgi:hypothetical protein